MPTRRTVLQSIGALGALPLIGLPACSRPPDPGREDSALSTGYFEALGYRRIESMPLITGYEFNGGVCYDDTRPEAPTGLTVFEQPCCRVEDLVVPARPGVLAGFTICQVRASRPAYRGELVEQTLAFLNTEAGLDPARLVIVTTDAFEGLERFAEQRGVGGQQIVTREIEEAVAAGDGSGYFAPKGHPYDPRMWTAGVYYAPEAQDFGSPLSYPLDGFLEIGEIVLSRSDQSDDRSEMASLGIERLGMARGDGRYSFQESVQAAIAMIDKEASANQIERPTAYSKLTELA